MNIQAVKDELSSLIPLDSGGSYSLMWEMLHSISMLKYVKHLHLRLINPRFVKIGSKKKLQQLCDLKYLKKTNDDAFIATNKTHSILDEVGYNRELLPKVSGKGGLNEIRNTDAFIRLMKEPFFNTFVYPRFPSENPYIKPDALMVLKDGNKYKLQFLEIEASKYDWENYILKKRNNYNRLAKDDIVYEYWQSVAEKLGISVPKKSDFFFSVLFIGDIIFEWEDCFEFKRI